MSSKFALLLSILILFSSTLISQKPIWSDKALEEDVNLIALQTDTIGFVWGLSENGLYKYDGLELSNKIDHLEASTSFLSIAVDLNQNFLIGTSKGGLIHFNPYKNKIVDRQIIKNDFPITSIVCNYEKEFSLFLSYGNGVLWKSPELDTLLTIDNILVSNEVYDAVIENGKVFLATDQGIQILERNKNQLSYKLLNKSNGLGDVIISNLIKTDKFLWASNFDSQIYKIEISTLTTTIIDFPLKSEINGIDFINEKLTVFTNNGIYSRNEDRWIKKYPNTGYQEIVDICTDEENNIWACSANNILSKANLGFLEIPNTVNKAQTILRIDKSFWIGSPEGLFIVNGDQKTKILDNNITCLKRINDDVLVGTFSSGIKILDKGGADVGSIDGWENNPNQSVLYIYPKSDTLYISSLTGVVQVHLSKVNGRYQTDSYLNMNTILGPGYIYQIIENDDGGLYFATDRQGIKIIKNDSLYHFTHFENGNTLGSIYSMAKCSAGRIWFASSTGYIGNVSGQIVNYVNNERFLQDPYSSLIATPDQKIVMVRNQSIDVYDPKTNHFIYYNNIIKTPNLELYLNCFTQEGNNIWLAKPNGIIKVGGFKNLKTAPETIINQVMVNLVDIGDENNFSEDQNNLEFKYSAAWMTDPERISFQYKLEGLDENWRTTRDQNAIYPMLRPGDYVFRLRASECGIFENEAEKSFEFTIKKSFYKTWWFLLLTALLLGTLFRKWRNERKKVIFQKEDLKKKRIEAQLISLQNQLNPHFLFNSFNTLIGLIEENPSKSITFTEKLTDFYRNILEFGKSDMINLKDEVNLVNTYIHLIKERFGEQLNIDMEFHDVKSYTIPPLTLQLLIENAIKHNIVSSKKPLIVEIKQDGNTIVVSNEIQPKFGNIKGTGIGLENIKKRHTLNNLKPPEIQKDGTHFIVTIYLNTIEG